MAKQPKAKAKKVEIKDIQGVTEHQTRLTQLAWDDSALAAPLVRDPVQEEMIRQLLQSSLFIGSVIASRTRTPVDDVYFARALRITMDPQKWKVIADFAWGEEGGFNVRPVVGFRYADDAETQVAQPEAPTAA